MEEQATEDVVNVDLQELVAIVDSAFKFVAHFQGFLDAICVGVDHDRVGISIDDAKLSALCQLFCALKNLSAFESREHGQWTSIEPRLSISKTSIHGVGSQLQRKLFDIPGSELFRCGTLVFHQFLDFSSAVD